MLNNKQQLSLIELSVITAISSIPFGLVFTSQVILSAFVGLLVGSLYRILDYAYRNRKQLIKELDRADARRK